MNGWVEPDDARGVFVSPRGSRASPGTRAEPLDAIEPAVALAAATGRVVLLAEGDYVARVAARVSLFGGYADDFSARDPARFVTRITGGGDDHQTIALVIAEGDVTLDGLRLRGGKSKFATAVEVRADARATIVDCVLEGGGRGPSPDGFTYSFGVNVPFAQQPRVTLRRCRIHGGENQLAWAIDGAGDAWVVEECTLVGGASATPSSSTCGVRGAGSVVLRGNAIDAGSGASATCVSLAGSGATLEGNRFTTRRGDGWTALRLPGTTAALRGNTVDGVPDDVFFGFAAKLAEKTWRYHENEGDGGWSFEAVTLVPRGLLYYWGDASTEPTGAGYGGPVQTFDDFLERGPASPLPEDVEQAIRRALRDAGVG